VSQRRALSGTKLANYVAESCCVYDMSQGNETPEETQDRLLRDQLRRFRTAQQGQHLVCGEQERMLTVLRVLPHRLKAGADCVVVIGRIPDCWDAATLAGDLRRSGAIFIRAESGETII
jgi:hypothetical protein